ncbi:hypothetical protein HanIR_Chr11g0554671 [Helianthus annuus]|nr:hypothetical protein HanIR_Chr11g0554671 [Helianthus annuus]
MFSLIDPGCRCTVSGHFFLFPCYCRFLFGWQSCLQGLRFFSYVVRSVRTVRATILGDLSSTLLMELGNGLLFFLLLC